VATSTRERKWQLRVSLMRFCALQKGSGLPNIPPNKLVPARAHFLFWRPDELLLGLADETAMRRWAGWLRLYYSADLLEGNQREGAECRSYEELLEPGAKSEMPVFNRR